MPDLAFDERATLELVASDGEHVVLDGRALKRLHRQGLVAFRRGGWTVTLAGRLAAQALSARG